MSGSSSQMSEQDPPSEVVTSSDSIPSLEPLAPMTTEKPAHFLTLPRELRDKVYTYLLSTEYNKREYQQPRMKTMRCVYTYRFHTSILYTNRQINNEAGQTFCMNNLFVHVSYSEEHIANWSTGLWGSVIAKGAKAQQSEHHAMKIELLSQGGSSSDHGKHRFIITCNELPALCRDLLFMDKKSKGSLASMKLRLMIGHEIGIDDDRAEEDEAAESHGVIQSYPAGGDLSIEGRLASMSNNIATTGTRVRRLLEPFRRLHSINSLQIIGPLDNKYKAEVIAATSKPLPSDQELLDHMITSSEEAISKFDSGDFASSISELRDALDELHGAKYLGRGDDHTKIIAGPYAGYYIWKAYDRIEFTIWTKLAWAFLKTGDIETAENMLMLIVQTFIDGHKNTTPGGHDIAMVYYLDFQIMEEWDHMGDYHMGDSDCSFRSHYFQEVVRVLKKGLRHEPGNSLLAHELEKKELELAEQKEIDDLTNMADRLLLKSDFEVLEGD